MTDDQKPYSKYNVLRRQTKDGNVKQEPKESRPRRCVLGLSQNCT